MANIFTCRSILFVPAYRMKHTKCYVSEALIEITDKAGLEKLVNDAKKIDRLAKYIDPADDFDYALAGCILLDYYDEKILTTDDCDSLIYRWQEIQRAIDSILTNGYGEVCFSESSADLIFTEHDRGFLHLYKRSNNKKYFLPERELLVSLVYGAVEFFNAVDHHLLQYERYGYEKNCCMDLLQKIYDKLGKIPQNGE